ncbi:SGNH/GDSL hydrolase family protein [uncultured Chryseobacterium sp.]|uniref:SGNH/GDSL hydrolase family protein n=1 Tax=uncultured Chryseobacterium sp. TaxID=259322 RepID=UPI00258D22E7|nr:SGNH/GDSL hydrolase family protein [uncultured Chryseobacterium sp.]
MGQNLGDVDPDLVLIKKVSDLSNESDPSLILTANSAGRLTKTNYAEIKSSVTSGVKGEATPISSPTPWAPGDLDLYEKWDVKTAGIYTNFKDSSDAALVVTTDDLANNFVQIWVKNGVSQKVLSEKPASIAKTLYDPTDNVNPATMKAAADRYDVLLEVNKGFLEKRPPIPEVPKNIDEATFATFGGLFLRNDNTYETNGNYPNIGLVYNMDVSNAYRLETTGMVPIGDNNRPAILGIKSDGTINTILHYTDAGFTGLKKLDVSVYEKVTIQVVKGQYPLITVFEYDEDSATDAKKYIDDAIDATKSESAKTSLVLDYFLSDGASYANQDSTNWTRQLFSWASKSMYPFPTSNFKSKDIEIPEAALTVKVITYNRSVGDNASWKAIIGRKKDGSYIVLEESVTGTAIVKIEKTYDVIALELAYIIVNNFADGGEATVEFVGGNVPTRDAVKDYIDDKVLDSNFSNFIYRKKGAAINSISNDVNSTIPFELSTNGVTIKSRGLNTGILLEKRTNMGSRTFEIRATVYSDTVLYMGTRALENSLTTDNVLTLDFGTKKYKNYMGSTVYGEGNIDLAIVSGRQYIIRYSKKEEYDKIEIVDTVSGLVFSVQMISFFQYDLYKVGQVSGANNIIISEMSFFAHLTNRPFIAFYGDSITEGDEVRYVDPNSSYKDRFATLIGERLGQPYYVSGRQGGTIVGMMERLRVEIPVLRPKYAYIQIGTNGQNTVQRLNDMIDFCESYGVEVILNTVTVHGASTAVNEMILGVVNDRKLRCVRNDIATSINGDGVTKDFTKFAPGGNYIHPNALGNLAMYQRALIDVKDIFVDLGVLVQ